MHLWIVLAAVLICASEARHYYPYSNYPSYPKRGVTTTQPHVQRSINDVTVVDEKTGIHYNPYSKHHPGRHVCTNQRNVTYPLRTKRVFCKPTYKKYMVRCGTQWCEGVRLVYEKYHKDVVANANHTVVDYTCCPGWTQVNWRSHGCNKPVCAPPCVNGGRCVKPNICSCPPGYEGTFCETKTSVYSSVCVPKCQNGGVCSPNVICICPPGYSGSQCERDVDECKSKPCDQICYNTPGSYKCECKENFVLQKDGQTCRKETDDGALEAKDLEQQLRLDKMDKRLQKLEKMMKDKGKNEVTQKDLEGIYSNMDKVSEDINSLSNKLTPMVDKVSADMNSLSNRLTPMVDKVSADMISLSNRLTPMVDKVSADMNSLSNRLTPMVDKMSEDIHSLSNRLTRLEPCEFKHSETDNRLSKPPYYDEPHQDNCACYICKSAQKQ